jgi:hypothetical protein
MKLIEILKQRVSNNNYDNAVSSWLSNMAGEIKTDASDHLEYVRNILGEFDKHNKLHSEAVLDIIERLLGDRAAEMSSYDLFSLIAVSYLHDCGMAVSDYEVNVMKIVENDNYDGKRVCQIDEASRLIQEKKDDIFKSDKNVKKVSDWLFYPGNDQKLFDYYSHLLMDYQDYRNGRIDRIRSGKDADKTNDELRTEYIRLTHSDRIETYLKTWGETKFASFPNKALGKRLAENIAQACRAHGQDADDVRKLHKKVMYQGSGTSNLQFVAMMLRIGDIVHFSYDRAPTVLRALHQFESDDSYEHWRIKSDSGVNYSISTDGEISYSAYCSLPKDYYNLMKYVDWIDDELLLYKRLRNEENWDSLYPDISKIKVNRDNIAHDESFDPVPNLRFTLNQKRIIELLMGVGLYKNKYACIRELYQNALDACRCQIARDEALVRKTTGRIEFGTKKEGEEVYLYCLDNGKGMSKKIIENYLLKIGNSYYKSPEFYQEQARTGYKFTPTSQFGIGILSCFMIGHRIEIVTKEEGEKCISCAINGPLEYFYYKTPSDADTELIPGSGTIVKIFLNKETEKEINKTIDTSYRHAFLLLEQHDDFSYYIDHVDNHNDEQFKTAYVEKSLYGIINQFIHVIPDKIELFIKCNDAETEQVLNKPSVLSNDNPVIDIFSKIIKSEYPTLDLRDSIENIEQYIIEVIHEGIQYRNIIALPIKDDDNCRRLIRLLSCNRMWCVDGISVHVPYNFSEYKYNIRGIVNFRGDNHPQLSIDRTEIVYHTDGEYDHIIGALIRKVNEKMISQIHAHLEKYNIKRGSELCDGIWHYLYDWSIDNKHLMETLCKDTYNDFELKALSSFLNHGITIGDFLRNERIIVSNYDWNKLDDFSMQILLTKLYFSSEVKVDGNKVTIIQENTNNDGPFTFHNDFNFNYVTVFADDYGNTFDEYDVITNLYPIIPDYLHRLMVKDANEKGPIKWMKQNNDIMQIFNQNPFAIDEELGLYESKKMSLRYFDEKTGGFHFWGMNNPLEGNDGSRNYQMSLTAFIAPRELSEDLLEELGYYKTKSPSYYKGLTEGWSILVTGESDEKWNTIIKAGKFTRKEMVKLLPKSFWEKYSSHTHVFPNGKLLKDYLK